MRTVDWTAIWYKCLACQRCFQFPDRLIAHKTQTECASVYKNKFSHFLDKKDDNKPVVTPPQPKPNITSQDQVQKTDDAIAISPSPKNKSTVLEDANSFESQPFQPQQVEMKKTYNLRKKKELKRPRKFQDSFVTFTKDSTLKFEDLFPPQIYMNEYIKETSYSCNTGKQRFRFKNSLKSHKRNYGQNKNSFEKNTTLSSNSKPCVECGKRFIHSINLKRHMLLHSIEIKPHKCEGCGKIFKFLSNLKRHQMVHSGLKPHRCELCGKCFKLSSTLKIHKLFHSDLKPHKCEVCGKCFKISSHLNRHNLIHSGIKPHKCEVCGKCFVDSARLNRHHLIHTGIKPHKCEVCGKCFMDSSHLNRHHLTHNSGIKPHQCKDCGKCFTQSGALKSHIMRFHMK